jgi:MerR family transcriptional regulator, light-induced transcriptional regulator
VGLAWARGELEVFEEHLYAEAVQGVLRSRIAQQRAAGSQARPRVLLATFPEELHGLGLLMAEAMLGEAGCPSLSLGTRVPLQQIVSAARAFRADVVGLSFCASMNPMHVLRGLEQLRGELQPQVAVWAGGSSPVLARHRIAGVRPVAHIGEVPALVAAWREEREAVA